MKRMMLITCCFIAAAVAQAQDVTTRLGDFSNVRVYDRINLKLVAAQENKIEITGSRANDVELVTKNGDLKIRMKFSKLLQGEDITATLYYKMIDAVEVYEGAYVSSEDTFRVTAFEITSKEGSKAKLNLDVQKLKTSLHTGGEAELTGKAANHDVIISSAGKLKARNLATAQTDITINAGGEAAISATDFVEAKTRAGGTIDIYGDPAQVNRKTAAGGSINIRNN